MARLLMRRQPAGSEATHSASRLRLSLGVFSVVLAVYLTTANGHLLGQDQEYFYRMAEAVALRGSFAIQPITNAGVELAGARGVDGQFYGQYAPGLPVALAPVVLVGRALSGATNALAPVYIWPHQ